MNWILVAIIVVCTTAGEVLQSAGMKHHGEIHDFRLLVRAREIGRDARVWCDRCRTE